MEGSLHHISGEFLHHEKGWPIYSGPHKVERRIHLEDRERKFAQDIASLICARTKLPVWRLTGPERSQDSSRMRQLLIAFLHLHPYSRLPFTHIARIMNRDRTTVMSALNRLQSMCAYPDIYHQADDLEWISGRLPRLNPDYKYFNILYAVQSIPRPLKRAAFQRKTYLAAHEAAE